MSAALKLALCFAVATGCYVEEPASYFAPTAAGAELVEVSPGVEVVADWGEPIFFAEDYYWWNLGGIWYWSTWYGGGWIRAPHVPPAVAAIDHPERFVHYRPAGWTATGHMASPPMHEYGAAPMGGGAAVHSRPAPFGGHR